jgi:regulator of sigma E protease
MQNVIAIVILIGGCIFLHELGHFLVGLLVGIKPKIFSIGFGPAIISRKIRDIEFRLSILPFGGYVQFAGEDPREAKGESYEFIYAPPWKRILVLFAGPFFNLVFGFLILFFILLYRYEAVAPYIHLKENFFVDKSLVAKYINKRQFLQEGDLIVSLDGKNIKTFSDLISLEDELLKSNKDSFHIVVERNGKRIAGKISKDELFWREVRSKVYKTSYSFFPYGRVEVGYVFSNSPAYVGGLKKGDVILSIDGHLVSLFSLIEYIKEHPGKEMRFEVLRKGKRLVLTIIPKMSKEGVGRIGIVPLYVPKTVRVNLSLFSAFSEATFFSWMVIYKNLEGIYNIITGKMSVKDSLGGPIMIGKMAIETLEEGWLVFLRYMAIISIVLMVMNLLPIPPLDGWHITMAGIEILRGKPISQKVQEGLMKFGFILLVGFIVFVLFLDIERLGVIKKIFGGR